MANIYVNHTGSSTPPYDTEAKASTDIQIALDAASAGDTVWIKADEDYVMDGADQQAAQLDVDADDNITVRGYYLTVGDQDYGGAYYKDSTNGWVVIDANDGSYHIFSTGNFDKLRFMNIKTINVNSSYIAYDLTPTVAKKGFLVQNCWMTGGQRAIHGNLLANPIIRDCKITGTYDTAKAVIYIATIIYGGVTVESCEFSHGDGESSIYCAQALTAYNNIFNISGEALYTLKAGGGTMIFNNTIYEASGGAINTGLYIPTNSYSCSVFNNIFVGCTTSINDISTGGANFGGWNCFYNNSSNWTLRDGDMVADPQFMDAANGNFKLKPTSPCLNTGRPTLDSGHTSIGAWQRKSLLR